MTFDAAQKAALSAPLSASVVQERSQSGRKLSYIEGWHAIAEANRIFGFDGWMRETVEIKMVSEKARKIGTAGAEGWGVTYICRVRITVGDIVREGCGSGHGIDRDLGQAHESALKEAETDAMKRALMTFGNPFGLALYDKTKANVSDDVPAEDFKYPIFVPGQDAPYTSCATQTIWVGEMNDMAARIRNSTKVPELQKEGKIEALRKVNQAAIDALPEELQNGLHL